MSNITLKPFEKEQLETYRRWVNDNNIALLVGRVKPVTIEEHEKWYESLLRSDNAVIFAIFTKDGQYIGNIWLFNINCVHRKAEVRIIIGEKDKQQLGYGTEAIEEISQFAFNRLNLNKLYAYVFDFNTISRRAFEKAGFIIEGELHQENFIDGQYHSTYLMARLARQG